MSAEKYSSKFEESEQTYRYEKETLLSKYNIPLKHFEFDYINKCCDGRELEKILLILQSKEEGYFPELIKETETRLSIINPKSKLLRKKITVIDKNHLEKNEFNIINKDLNEFIENISKNDKDLIGRNIDTYCDTEIRKSRTSQNNDSSHKTKVKISSTDYKAWDRYDPDTELIKIELEDEMKKKLTNEKNESRKLKESIIVKNVSTEPEAIFISNREKEQGNEFFKVGDFEEALLCYNKSIQLQPNVININNRAATYLKLKKYKEAISDCDRVLALEDGNLKAHLRKAEAFEKLHMFQEALNTIEFVIQHNPNNSIAQDLAERVRKTQLKTTRMEIIEVK